MLGKDFDQYRAWRFLVTRQGVHRILHEQGMNAGGNGQLASRPVILNRLEAGSGQDPASDFQHQIVKEPSLG
jgi:hypothetical protein